MQKTHSCEHADFLTNSVTPEHSASSAWCGFYFLPFDIHRYFYAFCVS